MGTSHEHLFTFMIITRRIFLRKNFPDNSCESQNTRFSENPAVYEITWKIMVEPQGPEITI